MGEPIEPIRLATFDPRPDIRLIAADMDGTLLDDAKALHEHFWPLVAELFARVGAVRGLAAAGADVGTVVCGKRAAYLERVDERFRRQVDQYYASQQVVADLLARPQDGILKVTVYDFSSAEAVTAPALAPFGDRAQVVVSGAHWVDVMDPATNKGAGIRNLQAALGFTPAQTMVFGDFLNDLEMMDAADYSFAMHNAHPLLRRRARYLAPPNTANGVVRTISSVLGLPWTT